MAAMADDVLGRILTGIKPTGVPHLGNYLGAIQPAIELTRTFESFLFIADLHALTILPDPEALREQTYAVAAAWLAFGLDPERVVFYRQSDIPEITNLAWALSCVIPKGLLNRAHSYKDAKAKDLKEEDISHGLYSYPVLMAADILLFDADVVPVGRDQKQHLEIAQEAARRFNNRYGDVLKIPTPRIDDTVMTIPGTDGRKMSKSYDNTIQLFVSDKALKNTVMSIKTDSTAFGEPLEPKNDPIMALYRCLAAPEQHQALEQAYQSGRQDPKKPDTAFESASENYFGWGHAKKRLLEVLKSQFEEPRKEYDRLMADKGYLDRLLAEGKDRARAVAEGVLARVRQATGTGPGTG